MCFSINVFTFNISCHDYYNTFVCLNLSVENIQNSASLLICPSTICLPSLCVKEQSVLLESSEQGYVCSNANILNFVLVLHLPVAYSITTGPTHKQTQWTAKKINTNLHYKKKFKQICQSGMWDAQPKRTVDVWATLSFHTIKYTETY